MKKITDQSFYKFMKCPHWLLRDEEKGGEVRSKIMQILQDDGLLPEKARTLLRDRDYEEVDLDDVDEAAQRTVELMKKGVQTIYRGALTHGRWVARPDILERVEGASNLGDWYYVAIDIKRSRSLKDEHAFQGVFYAELLKRIQGVMPQKGYIMRSDGAVEGYLLEDFATQFHLTLDSIEDVLNGEVDPHFLTSACKQSPWFSECKLDTQKCDNLSQINRIWRSEVHDLEDAGFDTVTKLADANIDQLQKVPGLTMDRLYFLQQQAISLIDGHEIRVGEVDLPEENGIALVIDIESDPLRDADYLFGVLVVDGEEATYHPFLAEKPEQEEEAWHAFTKFISQFPEANIYHYGWYEFDVFRRLTERYGAPPEVKNMFEHQMIDVLTYMREKVIFPTPFYSLKDIAKYIGFKWRHSEASGLNSVLWYNEWLEEGDRSALQDIVDYNEDDVRATWLVRNWALKKV